MVGVFHVHVTYGQTYIYFSFLLEEFKDGTVAKNIDAIGLSEDDKDDLYSRCLREVLKD